jgi:hypothetical protein
MQFVESGTFSLAFFCIVSAALSCQGRHPFRSARNGESGNFDPPHLRFLPLLSMELNQSDEVFSPYSYLDSRAAVAKLFIEEIGGRA